MAFFIKNYKSKISFINVIFFLILVNFVTFTLLYSLYAPTFEGPDEESHYSFSLLMFEGTELPHYAKSQPLYYALNSFLLNFIPHENYDERKTYNNPNFSLENPNRFLHFAEENFPFKDTSYTVHILRLFPITLGVFTLIFVYKFSKLIFQNSKWLPLITTTFVSMIPKFTFISSVVNNDSLAYVLGTIALFLLLKFLSTKQKKFLILLGIVTGVAAITKLNTVILLPLFIISIIYCLYSKQIDSRQLLKYFFIFGITFFISGGEYVLLDFIQNGSIIGETPFGEKILFDPMSGFNCITDPSILNFRIFEMYWGHLGWHIIPPPQISVPIGYVIFTLSLGGLFLIFVKKMKINEIAIDSNHSIVLFSSVGLMILGMTWMLYNGCNGDVRYTFPVISSFGVLIILGLFAYLDKKKLKFLFILLILFLVLTNIILLTEIDQGFDHGMSNILPSKIRYFASSQHQTWTNPSLAFDSNLSTLWHSSGFKENQSENITIDYRKNVVKNHLTAIAGNLWHPKDFEISGSNDGENKFLLKHITNESNWLPLSTHEYSFENNTPYRYYIIKINSEPGTYVEFSELIFSQEK